MAETKEKKIVAAKATKTPAKKSAPKKGSH
jgi:hypothetical protein